MTLSNIHLAELEDSTPTTGLDPEPVLSTFHLEASKIHEDFSILWPSRFS
jgi:hypothetical protein